MAFNWCTAKRGPSSIFGGTHPGLYLEIMPSAMALSDHENLGLSWGSIPRFLRPNTQVFDDEAAYRHGG